MKISSHAYLYVMTEDVVPPIIGSVFYLFGDMKIVIDKLICTWTYVMRCVEGYLLPKMCWKTQEREVLVSIGVT